VQNKIDYLIIHHILIIQCITLLLKYIKMNRGIFLKAFTQVFVIMDHW